MKKAKKSDMGFAKQFLAGTLAVAAVASLSFGVTTFAATESLDKPTIISTSYKQTSQTSKEENPKIPEGYVKANYKIVYSDIYERDLGEVHPIRPTEQHLSAEAAAEIAAQEIWELYGIDMEGKTMEVILWPDHGKFSGNKRPEWLCSIVSGSTVKLPNRATGEYVEIPGGYGVTMDGITGTVEEIDFTTTLTVKKVDPTVYEATAKSLVSKQGWLNSPVESAIYVSVMTEASLERWYP